MHKYFMNTEYLLKLLEPFVGGQCQVDTASGDVYRGVVRSFFIPKKGKRRIFINLEWLCIKRRFFDENDVIQDKWFLVPTPPSGFHVFDFEFITYYPQWDEDRVKLKGWKEDLHFHKKDDHTNLVRIDDSEFIPYYKTREQELKLALFIVLVKYSRKELKI